MSTVIDFESAKQEQQKKNEKEQSLEVARTPVTETMYATLSGEFGENKRVTVEYITDLGFIDRQRPRLTDEVVSDRELKTAIEATEQIQNGDYVEATQEIRQQIDHSALKAEKFEQDADVLVEFIRRFVSEARSSMLLVTGGLDAYNIPNGGGMLKAIEDRRAFLVAPGREEEIKKKFVDIYKTHFSGNPDTQYGSQATQLLAPNNLLDGKIGFTLPILQEGKDTTYLYFLYGETEEEADTQEDEDENDIEPANNNNYPAGEQEEEKLAA